VRTAAHSGLSVSHATGLSEPDGTTLVALDKHENNGVDGRAVTCSHVDPAGVYVTITGRLTG